MIKNILFIGLLFILMELKCQNFTATYSFNAVTGTSGTDDPTPPPVVNGLLFGNFKATGCSANSNASGRFSFTGWPVGSVNGADSYSLFTGAASPFSYYEATLYVKSGFTLDLSSVAFSVRRSGTGIRNYIVKSSVDNFSSPLSAHTGTNTKITIIPTDIFFWRYDSVSTSSDQRGSQVVTNHTGITDSVTFRFYAWNSEASGGTFSIDNVSFNGKVVDTTKVTTGMHENIFDDCDLFYPNPATDIILTKQTKGPVKIFNSLGVLILQKELTQGNETIDLRELENGLYYIAGNCGAGKSYRRLVIRR